MSPKSFTLFAVAAFAGCSLPPEADQLQGMWLSDGYGIGADIDGGQVETFAVKDRTCLSEGKDPLFGLLQAFDVDLAADAQSFLLRQPGTAQAIRFERVAALPAACSVPPEDTPMGNFEVFADIFATHYAFFDVYGVDWPSRVAAARARVTAETSQTELFTILSEMVAPLRDGHISLMGRVDGERRLFEPNRGALFEQVRAAALAADRDPGEAEEAFRAVYWEEHVAQRILSGQGVMAGSGFIQYGMAGEGVGYLNFLTMAGYATGDIDSLEADIATLHEVMDAAMALFEARGAERVIIDLSMNFGGYDEVAVAVAGRFAATPTFAYSEYPADADDPITLRRMIEPSERARFGGPITLITSEVTVSAGEILAMSLRALPQTRHIGAATRGAFSDVLEKELPNGWIVELSNEVYADHRGIVWEGRGITPDRILPVLSGGAPLDSHAGAVASAVRGD